MGGSLQCDLSYENFHIGDRAVRVDKEPRVNHILGEEIDKDSTFFLDTGVNTFRVELTIQEIEELPAVIEHEVECFLDSPLLWTMFFDGLSSKEGLGVGVVFVSPKKNTFRYFFHPKLFMHQQYS